MVQSLRKVVYFSVETPHTAGKGLRILAALRDAGVNLHAYKGFPTGRNAQLDFVPEKPARFKAVARKLKLKVSAKKIAFLLQGDDKVGALTGVLGKLAKANINLVSLSAVTAGKRRYGMIFWVKKKDVARASRVLGAR